MISCTEFIPAYSEMFKFVEKKGGQEAVRDFWDYFADRLIGTFDLESLVREHGLCGCWIYWQHTLSEESANFAMELDEDAGEFRITMHRCPSKGRLIDYPHLEPYHNYCGHCDVVYHRILESLGYEYIFDDSRVDQAACAITVRSKK